MKTQVTQFTLAAAVAVALASPAYAAGIDVVFKIDESGSMFDDISAVQANVVTIYNALPTGSSVGLVGYGTVAHGPSGQLPHVHTPLTMDSTILQTAVNDLVASGGLEQGYLAVYQAATDTVYDESLLFTGAPYCNILITDETPDQGGATRQDAIDAMNAVEGIFFGILPSGLFGEAQPLAEATGGQLFDLAAFRADPTPVIEAVLAACVEAAQPVAVDIHPGSCPNPFNYGKKGVVPVAIIGTEDFDVTTVDVNSIRLNGDCEAVRYAYEDAAQPYEDGFSDPLSELDCLAYEQTMTLPDGTVVKYVDGITDLVLKFDSACVQNTVADPAGTPYVQLWTITGTYGDGIEFTAQDVVRVQ